MTGLAHLAVTKATETSQPGKASTCSRPSPHHPSAILRRFFCKFTDRQRGTQQQPGCDTETRFQRDCGLPGCPRRDGGFYLLQISCRRQYFPLLTVFCGFLL